MWPFLRVVALVGVLGYQPVYAAIPNVREVSMTIGPDWALIKEIRRVSLTPGRQELTLEGIPVEAELTTLQIRARRFPILLEDWYRRDQMLASQAYALDYGVAVVENEGDVVWSAASLAPPDRKSDLSSAPGPVTCIIRQSNAGVKAIEVSYLIRGFTWNANYSLLVRGNALRDSQVSVDLEGLVNIHNPSARFYDDVLIHLVGAETFEEAVKREPGILLFKETPLADFWKAPKQASVIEHSFRLPKRVSLKPRGSTEVTLIKASRVRAQSIYYLGPTSQDRKGESALQRTLVLANTVENQLGWRLPPGKMNVYRGSLRNQWERMVSDAIYRRKEQNPDRYGSGR